MGFMKLRMQPGTDSVTHGEQGWIPNSHSHIVEVPDDVGRFMLADGRSGCVLVEDPEPGEIVCPCCHHAWKPEKE